MNFRDYFTDSARRALQSADGEARRMGHNYIGTEHILLGLLHDRDTATTLDGLGAPPQSIRVLIERIVDIEPLARKSPAGPLLWNGRALRVIEDIAPREVAVSGLNYIAPSHLLLGLVREGDGFAGTVLARLGVSLDRARRAVHPKRGDK
jgi:ATP-dependent Clp protease ATP-binding subunit ClpC